MYCAAGTQFESLVSLVQHYSKGPLYKRVRLTHPITRDMLKPYPGNALMLDEGGDGPDQAMSSYMDPTSVDDSDDDHRITVKALYDYKANRDDELSFCKHAIITNVKKVQQMWWVGDYGGKKQLYFPANYVVDVPTDTASGSARRSNNQSMGSDDLAGSGGSGGAGGSGSISNGNAEYRELDVDGAVVELEQYESTDPELPVGLVLRVQTSALDKVFQIGCDNEESACAWRLAINQAAQNASALADQQRKREKNLRVAKEMSDMIIYFRSVPFKEDREMSFYEMCSFPETKAEKYFFNQSQQHFLRYGIVYRMAAYQGSIRNNYPSIGSFALMARIA